VWLQFFDSINDAVLNSKHPAQKAEEHLMKLQLLIRFGLDE
jgi:hypothetical protein